VANPVVPAIDAAKANTLSGGPPHGGTGASFIPFGVDETSSPAVFTRLTQLQYHLFEELGGVNQGKVIAITDPANLNVGCFALKYRIGATDYSYAGDVTFACNANKVNHLYLDTAGTLKKQDDSWPAGDILRLAKVTTNASAVTAIDDSRWTNLQVGVVNNWWAIAPTAAIGCNGQALQNVGLLDFKEPIELTIAGGAVTITQTAHKIDTEGDAADDDLVTINSSLGGSDEGQLLLLRCENDARFVTVKSTGNITLHQGDALLGGRDRSLLLVWKGPLNKWVELARSPVVINTLLGNVNGSGAAIDPILRIRFTAGDQTINSDTLTYAYSRVQLLPQSGTADNLATISGGGHEDEVTLWTESGNTITVKHGTGNIETSNGKDFVLTSRNTSIVLRKDTVTAKWHEVCRSVWSVAAANDAEKAVPYDESAYVSGTLTINTTYKWRRFMPSDFTFVKAVANVGTAPVGSSCIVDVRYNGASLFANEGEMCNIAAGTNTATSATKNAAQTGGQYLEVRTGTAVGSGTPAADLTVTIIGRVARL